MKYPGVKALTFDVGGTVFDWRGTIEAELHALSAKDEPILPLETFDVSASDFDDLVEKLT